MSEAARRQWPIVLTLGTTQTLAWASSYYLVAIVADPMAADIGISPTTIYAAFSAALLVSALFGPRVGRTIDNFGGREVLAVSNLIFAAGLAILAYSPNGVVMTLGWFVLGAGMGVGLYDSAFAALGHIYGDKARPAITGITLIAGFASTVGWPLTTWGTTTIGWRYTCLSWAAAHVTLGLALNLLFLPKSKPHLHASVATHMPNMPMDRAMWLLAMAFAAGWIVSTAMAAHLPRLLAAAGATTTQSVAAAALIGPAQVAARVLEAGVIGRVHALWSARLATITHPVGAALLLMTGGWFAAPFAILHGAGNGIFTIARGTVPLAVFGSKDYGYRLGILGAPARIGQAGAPLAFGALIEAYGTGALYASTLLCLMAFVAFLLVHPAAPDQAAGLHRDPS